MAAIPPMYGIENIVIPPTQSVSPHTQTTTQLMTLLISNNMHGNPHIPPHGAISTLPQIPLTEPYVPYKLCI